MLTASIQVEATWDCPECNESNDCHYSDHGIEAECCHCEALVTICLD